MAGVPIQTLGLLAAAAALLGIFLVIEARISFPLVPLGLFRNRNVSSANVVGVLMAAGMFSYFFFSALYLQLVLEYTPLEVGLAYLPGNDHLGSVLAPALRQARDALRDQAATAHWTGLDDAALLLLARVPVDGNWAIDILPATIAIGIGAGIAFNPILLAAMSGVAPDQAGLASGVVNTAFMMGGAVGLAILASLADSRHPEPARFAATTRSTALNGGYHLAFVVGAVFLVASAVIAAVLLRVEAPQPHGAEIGGPAGAEAD